ncbi:hypothetical protein F4821DRAFT_224779 [Hypoxylon rubiginosum]|uniref:Uncharacterized protein n=1 Tax=Hypoxylon rubiginosum TaxID=110542 RepID=A0ACC0DHN8_9PEZI|nr:hypothetical protein F4821DRAFT_224779 [Hypoxylon rubiginosum]
MGALVNITMFFSGWWAVLRSRLGIPILDLFLFGCLGRLCLASSVFVSKTEARSNQVRALVSPVSSITHRNPYLGKQLGRYLCSKGIPT